ncbi:MAG: sensor histidine kinase, partial [Jatrophihabitantaceae bacterium]
MLGRLRAGFRPEDGWLALGFVVAAGLEAVIRYHADRAALISNLIGALTFTVLALRRSRPLLTVSVMSVIFSAASFVQAALLPDESGDALVPIFALLVVSYSLGAYATRRQLRWGAWQPVLLVLVVDVSAPSANSLTSAALFITLFVSAAPIVAGRLVRGRRMLVRRLREQAAQIEAHRRVQVEVAVVAERLRMVQRFHETLVIGMQSLATRAAGAEASSGERAIGEVEREARALLSQTREEVVGLTAAIPDAGAATHRPQLARFGDAAQPWSVLAGGALCTGLLVETRTLPLHVPQPLAWLACVVLAVPLVFAWRRPLLAICTLWTLAALFDAFVAPLDGSFTAIGLSFVPAFTIAALEPRRRALIGLAACLLGELACFGPHGLASNGAVVLVCWIGGSILYERARLAEQLRVNNSVLDEQRAAAARKAAADERLRAARELHDAVGHSLTVVTLQAGAARRLCISDPARAHSVLRTIATVARDGLLELRHGAASADPGHVADSRSVDDLLATARAAGLHIDAHVEDVAALLGPDAQFAMYRVVQEALTNILKHAPGATAQLRIQRSRECIEIVVHNSAPAAP